MTVSGETMLAASRSDKIPGTSVVLMTWILRAEFTRNEADILGWRLQFLVVVVGRRNLVCQIMEPFPSAHVNGRSPQCGGGNLSVEHFLVHMAFLFPKICFLFNAISR